jgi:orotidine-5'-phosphate decarboxylase
MANLTATTGSPIAAQAVPRATAIVALDVASSESALGIVSAIGDLCRFYKVGAELFTACGPAIVRSLGDLGCEVFLDLKVHDIPNTARGACLCAARMGARIVTVHATGDKEMMEAAIEGAHQGSRARGHDHECEVFAVTVLTSMDADRIGEVWGRPVTTVQEEVLRLADLARRAGVPGVVCGGTEAAAVRAEFGNTLKILVPGVRLAGSSANDQVRVVTPAGARAAGATYVIVGRTVTSAPAVRDAMRQVLSELIGTQ